MKQFLSVLIVILATPILANAADRPLGRLPDGRIYIKDEVLFCLKAVPARALSRADVQRQKVDVPRLRALHPSISDVVGNHTSARRWLDGEPLPAALRHNSAEVPAIARSLTAMLGAQADAAVVLEELRNHPDVEWASLNILEPVNLIPNDAQWTNQWGPVRVLATSAWDVAQATTTLRIAIVDTGVDLTHPDLPIVYNRGFGGNPTGDAMRDVRGGNSIDHGTHVAGIAAASRNNSIGIAGIAQLGIMAMGCAVWNGSNQYQIGSSSDAINDAVANNATVINCSFGQAAPLSAAMSNALNNAQNNFVVVVCAAGNNTNNVATSPSAGWAQHAWPILVSNIQQNDALAIDSNFGNAISLAAPGSGILSTFTTNFTTPAAGGTYGTMSGTSQASPHVAGAAGMIRSMSPGRITGIGTKDLLYRMAQDLAPAGRDTTYGFGMLQVPASFLSPLRNANTFVGSSPFFIADGSYELPYANLPDAISATPVGGTIVLNGGLTGSTLSFPAQTLTAPVTLRAFPDRPVTFGN
jgi:subtilisin family serine protease